MTKPFDLMSRLMVVFAIAIAMIGSGFAHRMGPAEVNETLLAYVSAGGALEDLCVQGGLGSGVSQSCDACRLVDSAALPDVDAQILVSLPVRLLDMPIHPAFPPIAPVSNPSCPVRAPPIV